MPPLPATAPKPTPATTSPFTPDTTGSSFDYASASGGNGTNAIAGQNGSFDSASASGQNVESGAGGSSDATAPANFDFASAIGNNTTPTTNPIEAIAGGGGTELGGSSDTAFVLDPSGTVGSTAFAGDGFNSDLAGVFGDALNATANTANNVVDILPSL